MRGFATHPIEFMPKLLLILRFYRSAMLFFCGAVSVALAWLVTGYGPSVVPLCLAGKMVIYPVYLYVWIIPRYTMSSTITAIWGFDDVCCWVRVAA